MAVFGIDVSQWRGEISWPEVAASGLATFASTRIIDGDTPDSRWQANAQGARDHIALPIAHARVKPGDQAARAGRFLNMAATIHDLATVGLMVDVEDQGVAVADGMAFCRAVHQLAGRWPTAYVPAWWLARQPSGWTLPSTPWWPSRYVPEPWTPEALQAARPALHPGFEVMGPWQFTSSGEVAGVPPPVDRNVFFGTEVELGRLLRGETMAIIVPFADWRPLPEATSQPKIIPQTVIFHTAVGRLATTERFFREGTAVESHLMVGGPWDGPELDGVIWQWMSLDRQADANLDANDFAISIETSDNAPASAADIAPWSPKQLASLVRLGNWLAERFGIPRRLCPAWDLAGFGWHAMWGAPSHWTPSAGKVCPGAARIHQLKTIVLPAIFAGRELEDDMFEQPDRDKLAAIHAGLIVPGTTTPDQTIDKLFERVRSIEQGMVVPGTTSVAEAFELLFNRVRNIEAAVTAEGEPLEPIVGEPVIFEMDSAAVAASLASDAGFLDAVAKAVNDDAARRQAE